ncbi:MAG: hypothetical protein ACE5JX_04225 [Acidobacteriota bacterium]
MIRRSLRSEGLYGQPDQELAPERRLALGILLQAVRDVADREGWHGDALDWFFRDDDLPGSLLWVCSLLELQPEGIRRWVDRFVKSDRRWQRRLAKRLRLPFQTGAWVSEGGMTISDRVP